MKARLFIIMALILPRVLEADVSPLWFNSGMNNRDITFSPDGKVMLTTLMAPRNQSAVIAISHLQDDAWTPLTVAPFSGKHPDIEPAYSPDGSYLYFASRRPKPKREGDDWDLWRVAFTENHWGQPEHLGDAVNTTGNEFYPSVTLSGTLYFTATRADTIGKEDIYRAAWSDGQFSRVENIGSPVNSEAYEFNAFIAPDESYLLFGSQGRTGEKGGGDIYYSQRDGAAFKDPVLLPELVNTNRLDYCPAVYNGMLYFTSERFMTEDLSTMSGVKNSYTSAGNGLGDIYRVNVEEILPE